MTPDFITLRDDSYMPFGRYEAKNRKMKDVPARYLLWLWNDGLYCETTAEGDRGDVARYIKTNMRALSLEHPDTIVRDEEIPPSREDEDDDFVDEETDMLDFTKGTSRGREDSEQEEEEDDRW